MTFAPELMTPLPPDYESAIAELIELREHSFKINQRWMELVVQKMTMAKELQGAKERIQEVINSLDHPEDENYEAFSHFQNKLNDALFLIDTAQTHE